MYNWNKVKQEITVNVEKVFNSNIQPTYPDFSDGLELFRKVVTVKCNIKNLDGLTKSVLPALHSAYITELGKINPVKILAEELEPFLKKIIYLVNGVDYTNDKSKTLGPLMQELKLSNVIIYKTLNYSTLFDESNIQTYKGQNEYIEYLCRSYIVRNQVHNSPNWTYLELFTNLSSILVAYLYPVLKYKTELTKSISKMLTDEIPVIYETFDNQAKALFEFISLGTNTVEIKKQIINSSLLYYLMDKQESTVEELKVFCNRQHNSNLEIGFYNRTVDLLVNEKKLEFVNRQKSKVKLAEEEKVRLQKAVENFNFQEKNFLLAVKQILQPYNIEGLSNEIISKLNVLLESNYNIDIYEIYNQMYETTNNTNCIAFLSYLESKVNTKENATNLFFELLLTCEENDFLHKMSASKVLSKYTNSAQLQNYLRLQERVVFVDAQLLLYALCAFYKEVNEYNVFYNITKDLLRYADDRDNVNLFTSIHYVFEAAYHLKEALLLIPFEELGFFEAKNSQNVFYKFYQFLSEEDMLDDDVNNFEDFLRGFNLEYDDVFSQDFLPTTVRIITEFIEEVGIRIQLMKKVDQDSKAFEAFKNALNTLGRPRQEITIENDATMLYFLTDKYDSEQEPFFVTWDLCFYEARKKYLEISKGCKNFYLYSPSKLLTNFSLSNIEINPEGVTKEFLSILNADDIQAKTNHFLDTINFLFDIEKEERRKYISKLKEFKKKYIIDIETKPDETLGEEKSQPYSALVRTLTYNYNKHFNKRSKYNLEDLKLLLSDKNCFDPVISLLDSELEYYTQNYKFSENLISQLNTMIYKVKLDKKK